MQPSGRAEDLRLHFTILRCQAGDDRAFAEIMHRFEARTLAYLTGLLGDEGEDVQQDVWLGVYRGIHELADPAAFRTWLFRLTRHRAIDALRRWKRERELLESAASEADEAVASAEDEVDAALLENALAGLPPPQREVMLLRYRDELSYEEIAQVVGCPIGTVRTRLYHAKRKLTSHMSEE